MPLETGSLSLRHFRVTVDLPSDAALAEAFARNVLPSFEHLKLDPLTGWTTGRHLTDRDITPDTIRRGGVLNMSLVKAQRKVPEKTLKAEVRAQLLARMQQTGQPFLPRSERLEIAADAKRALTMKALPSLTDIGITLERGSRYLITTAAGATEADALSIHWRSTHGITILPIDTTYLARTQEVDPDQVAPCSFAADIEDNVVSPHLGHDFLTWLWFMSEKHPDAITVPGHGTIGVLIEGPLHLHMEGSGAHTATLRQGNPANALDANASLRAGKKLAAAKLTLCKADEQYTGTFNATDWVWRSLRLPCSEHLLDATSLFQHYVRRAEDLREITTHLFTHFLKQRTTPDTWPPVLTQIREWVSNRRGVA